MIVIRRQMGVPHGHLYCTVSHQLHDGSDVNRCHSEPTRKRVPIFVPCVVRHLGLQHRRVEPIPLVVMGLPFEEDAATAISTSTKALEGGRRRSRQRSTTRARFLYELLARAVSSDVVVRHVVYNRQNIWTPYAEQPPI
jgi:hypothetical protein